MVNSTILLVSPVKGCSASTEVIRIVRITRLLRILRIMRLVRFVRSLRNLVSSIAMTMRSLGWPPWQHEAKRDQQRSGLAQRE